LETNWLIDTLTRGEITSLWVCHKRKTGIKICKFGWDSMDDSSENLNVMTYRKRAAAKTSLAVSQCPRPHQFPPSGGRLVAQQTLYSVQVDTSPPTLVGIVCELSHDTTNIASLVVEAPNHRFYHIVYISLTPADFPPSIGAA
jgi:hypothetical protein